MCVPCNLTIQRDGEHVLVVFSNAHGALQIGSVFVLGEVDGFVKFIP